MKLHDINDEIAKACDMRPKAVLAVQKETFNRLREIIERGDRATIPGFGTFWTKERSATEGGEAEKSVRFRLHTEEGNAEASGDDRKARRQAKKAKKAEAGEEGDEQAGDATDTAASEPQ